MFSQPRVLNTKALLDLHCHLLPGVDDGAPNLESAIAMARVLVEAGFCAAAPSPHVGEGAGGDVPMETAEAARAQLRAALEREGIELALHPNAEHYVSAELFARQKQGRVVPVGGSGHWLLVELPWQEMTQVEEALFRLQAGGHRLLLAHPERTRYVDLATLERLVARGVRLQLEIGSFANLYGRAAHHLAQDIADRGLGHVLATDMHSPNDGATWVRQGLMAVADRYGKRAVQLGADANPQLILGDAEPDQIEALAEAR